MLRVDLPWLGEIGRPRTRRRIPVILSKSELTSTILMLTGDNGSWRNCCTGQECASGLRAGELVQSTLGTIDVDAHGDHWLHIVGKGSKAGKVVLPGLARGVLVRYLMQSQICKCLSRLKFF